MAHPKAKDANQTSRPTSVAAPPAYTATDSNGGRVVENGDGATPIDITAAFASLRVANDPLGPLPDPDTCLAHLKLLAALEAMKEDIGYTDGLFGIWDTRADSVSGDEKVSGDLDLPVDQQQTIPEDAHERRRLVLSKLREKRWALFVARAVDRYEAWWTALFGATPTLTNADMTTSGSPAFEAFPTPGPTRIWTDMQLPPLDVLMVFHTHMLNPRAFLEDCMRYGARDFWATGMPWEQVDAAINTEFGYVVRDDSKAAWIALTGRAWDNIEEPPAKKLKCPACSTVIDIPWTTCGLEENPKTAV